MKLIVAWSMRAETYKLQVNCDQNYSYSYMSYKQEIYILFTTLNCLF